MARIILGVPSSGMISESSAQASWNGSLHHRVYRIPSCLSGPNYNNCLIYALNECEQDRYDVHAQIHADLAVVENAEACKDCEGKGCLECGFEGQRPYRLWMDVLYEEMTRTGADFISTPMAIKNGFLVTSCGIGNPENRWNPWRRFCANEFKQWPDTFTAADVGYPDKYLIHNHALCMFNMKSKLWWETDEGGCIRAMFNFTEDIRRDGATGRWVRRQDSEDWAFSRRLWELGAKTVITSKIKTLHHGSMSFENISDDGAWQHGDEGTASQWRPELEKAS